MKPDSLSGRPATDFTFAQPLPEGKRLSPLLKRGSGVRMEVAGGYLVTGILRWRRLNVAVIDGQITKVGA